MGLLELLEKERQQEREIDNLAKAIYERRKEVKSLEEMLNAITDNRKETRRNIALYIEGIMRELK